MHRNDLLNMKNLLDVIDDPGFWDAMGILMLVTACMLAFLYIDRYKRWSAIRAERAKWLHWNRPKT
jgi:hypothetical protein